MTETQNSTQREYDDEINIKEIFSALLDQKFFITSLVIIFAVLSIIYSLLVPKIWVSNSLVALSSEASASSSSSNSLGGMAALAGISVSSSSAGGNKAQLVISSVHSRDFVKHLISFPGVLPKLMATKNFNQINNLTEFNPKVYDNDKGEWVNGRPDFHLIYSDYRDAVSTHYDPLGTGFITISVKHRSPLFAHELLLLIINEINNRLRNQDLLEADASLEYLYAQLPNVTESEVRLSITQLIESQLRTKMLANIRQDYAIYPLDSPFIPELRFSPQRTKIVFIGTLLGLIFSIVSVLARYYFLKSLK